MLTLVPVVRRGTYLNHNETLMPVVRPAITHNHCGRPQERRGGSRFLAKECLAAPLGTPAHC